MELNSFDLAAQQAFPKMRCRRARFGDLYAISCFLLEPKFAAPTRARARPLQERVTSFYRAWRTRYRLIRGLFARHRHNSHLFWLILGGRRQGGVRESIVGLYSVVSLSEAGAAGLARGERFPAGVPVAYMLPGRDAAPPAEHGIYVGYGYASSPRAQMAVAWHAARTIVEIAPDESTPVYTLPMTEKGLKADLRYGGVSLNPGQKPTVGEVLRTTAGQLRAVIERETRDYLARRDKSRSSPS